MRYSHIAGTSRHQPVLPLDKLLSRQALQQKRWRYGHNALVEETICSKRYSRSQSTTTECEWTAYSMVCPV